MRRYLFLLLLLFLPAMLLAQRSVRLRNLWAKPRVHVSFAGYQVSFTVRDINKALRLLHENGNDLYGTMWPMDSAVDRYYEMYPGTHTEYKDPVEPLLQNGVGVYLLSVGLAEVEDRKHKRLAVIIDDMYPVEDGAPYTFASFYDPETHMMLFSGRIDAALIGKDPGIDD